MVTLRLLTYNVRALRDDADAVARTIRRADPHVVCIQEAPRLFRWRTACAALARHSGLVVVGGGRPSAGNLILSALAVDAIAVRDQLFSKDRGLHRRGAALALLRLGGVPFVVAGTHLDLMAAPRLRHIRELHGALGRFAPAEVASIVAADVNDEPGGPAWLALSAERVDAFGQVGAGAGFTYPATQPGRRIDGVLSPSLAVRAATPLEDPDVALASDHCPVLVEIELS